MTKLHRKEGLIIRKGSLGRYRCYTAEFFRPSFPITLEVNAASKNVERERERLEDGDLGSN